MPKKMLAVQFVENQREFRLSEHKLDLLATLKLVNVARIAPSETRGQNWIQRQFRGETKPLKHLFGPSEQTRRTLCKLD